MGLHRACHPPPSAGSDDERQTADPPQTLSDFKSTSCITPFSYIWLWILVLISIAVYAADAFTAVNLLAFNKWSSQVKPKIDFDIAKWIFAVCIIVSYVFLAYRWIRAIRVMRSGGVADSYLEPLAAVYQSLRITPGGQGWRRFLVFAELTRSRKGVDYIALFVYFQFKGASVACPLASASNPARRPHHHPRPGAAHRHQCPHAVGCHASPDHSEGGPRGPQGHFARCPVLHEH